MNYQVVELKEKIVAGICVRTGNNELDVNSKISKVWDVLYCNNAIGEISDKVSETTYGLYTNYESDCTGQYDMLGGCEVSTAQNLPDKFKSIIIPAGKYAKFTFHGDVEKDVFTFWDVIWKTELNRKYTCDFEEYLPCEDCHDTDINIYIALVE